MIASRDNGTGALISLHGDHLGGVAVITNSSGNVVITTDYDPWGQIRDGGTARATESFTGQRRDSTGLLFYNARSYDPAVNGFVSAGTQPRSGSTAACATFTKRLCGACWNAHPSAGARLLPEA